MKEKVLLTRQYVNRANWNKFKDIAKYMNLTSDELLDKVISVTVQKYDIKIVENVKNYLAKSPEPEVKVLEHSESESSEEVSKKYRMEPESKADKEFEDEVPRVPPGIADPLEEAGKL